MIIIWRGAGLLGLAIPVIGTLSARCLFVSLFGEQYVAHHNWPIAAGLAISGLILFLFARHRDEDDPGHDTLYYIPLRVWAFLIAIVAAGYMFAPVNTSVEARTAPSYRPRHYAQTQSPSDSSATDNSSGNSGTASDGDQQPSPQPAIVLVHQQAGSTSPANAPDSSDGTIVIKKSVANLTLESIAFDSNGHSTAMLRGQQVKVGDRIASYTVLAIHENSITLQAANGRRRVLRVGETEDPL